MPGPVRLVFTLLLVTAAPASGQRFATDSAWLAERGFFLRQSYAVVHLNNDSIRARGRGTLRALLGQLGRIEARQTAAGVQPVLHASEDWRDTPADTGCAVAVFLNGGEIGGGTDGRGSLASIDRALSTRDLTGLEIHEGASSPVQPGVRCGSLLLWSRLQSGAVDEDFSGLLRTRAFELPSRNPVQGVRVTLMPLGREEITDSGGWASFGALAPGRYRLEARLETGETWTGEVWVRAYAISQFAIEVERSDGVGVDREGERW